ncbi:alpha/beta hydrolase [Arthrobacter sp. SA17]
MVTDREVEAVAPVNVRVYERGASTAARPAVLWMHGGGFVAGTLDWGEAHAVAAELSHLTDAVVVSVDYRWAGENSRYPSQLDDVLIAWNWMRDTFPDATGYYIGGASAGANLAAGGSVRLRDEGSPMPDGMLLAYGVFHWPIPALDLAHERLLTEIPDGFRGNLDGHIRAFRNYAGTIHHLSGPAAPGNANLIGMPPAALLISEYDDLRNSSVLFALQLEEAGATSRTYVAPGMIHGHLNWFPGPTVPEIGASIQFLADCLTTWEHGS